MIASKLSKVNVIVHSQTLAKSWAAYIANFPCLANHLDRRQIWPRGFPQGQDARVGESVFNEFETQPESRLICVFFSHSPHLLPVPGRGKGDR